MGKHDNYAHNFHIPKQLKFKQPKPPTPINHTQMAPQVPKMGTLSRNMRK